MKKQITKDIYYVGVNDHQVDLFEGQYVVPNGMAYNSYVIKDEKIAVIDSVDHHFASEWISNVKEVLDGRKPDYFVVQHMEPDHSSSLMKFVEEFPDCLVIGNNKTFNMIKNFFHKEPLNKLAVVEGERLELGKHALTFVFAPMVHWPEVMFSYDECDKVLFSADAFGKFGALDIEEDWACEARRYYIGIVGKYGAQVQNVLKKAAGLDIKIICPLHGPVLSENLSYYLSLYDTWSSYRTETEGVAIFYTSVYGNTKTAVEMLAKKLKEDGAPKVVVNDLARSDMAECVEDAFRYGKIVLATTTYNAEIFPFMSEFINHLVERNWQNKEIALIENGSWAPTAAKVMKAKLEKCKNLDFVEPTIRILSSIDDEGIKQIGEVSSKMTSEYQAIKNESSASVDPKALFNIGYGLYVVTTKDGAKDNACIVNTVSQITSQPMVVAVSVNKANYTCELINKTKVLNVNCLNVDAPFKVFQDYGFVSGRDKNKFEGVEVVRSKNGLVYLTQYCNSLISLKVKEVIDMGTHDMFICEVTESIILNKKETMTYTYYQTNVKPKPEAKKTGYVCKVCGYVYEGEELPEDFICPLCKHGASDFEPLK